MALPVVTSNATYSYQYHVRSARVISIFNWMIRYATMHHLPGYSNEYLLLHENLVKVKLLIMLVKDLIDKYFHEGFRYKEIIASLKNNHGIKFGLRKLHRSLRRANFYWEGTQSPFLDRVTFIQHELEGSGSCSGYRTIHQRMAWWYIK